MKILTLLIIGVGSTGLAASAIGQDVQDDGGSEPAETSAPEPAERNPEINPPEVDIFDKIHDAYEREDANGGFIKDDPAPPEPTVDEGPEIEERPMTEREIEEVKEEFGDPDKPFGDPANYDDGQDTEPLPAKEEPEA